jgi:hypothetical protein
MISNPIEKVIKALRLIINHILDSNNIFFQSKLFSA